MNKKKEIQSGEIEIFYTKEQILQSKRFKDKRDILNTLLQDDKTYKLFDVGNKLKEFLDKEVV